MYSLKSMRGDDVLPANSFDGREFLIETGYKGGDVLVICKELALPPVKTKEAGLKRSASLLKNWFLIFVQGT